MTPKDKQYVRIWYWSGALLVFCILIIGGITRLTGSGLSMVDWRPITGVIPPITEAQWLSTFEQYRQFPEYQQVNKGMSLGDFKFIFFWEYLHRMAGRLIGLVFIIPFAWFLITRKLDVTQFRRALLLLVLGLGQGVMGWYMVVSGLVDVPQVSPYRLAAHLLLAFLIFGCCVWFALDLRPGKEQHQETFSDRSHLRGWLAVFLVLLVVQIAWGAFVAGHNAGHIYNTFPKMHTFWLPPELWLMQPLVANFFANAVTVQWIHRIVGTVLALIVLGIWLKVYLQKSAAGTRLWSSTLLLMMVLQYALGIFTLLYHVPLVLGVLHQAVAMVILGVTLGFMHSLQAQRQIA